MARPRKISEEDLLDIINKYIEDTPYISTLKYSALVEYAKLKLGYKDITYQDFSRNSTVKQFVALYKERKGMTSYIKLNDDKLEKLSFDVDALVDKYQNNPKQLKAVLKVFREGYDRSFALLNEYEESSIKNVNIIKEQEKFIKELKEKNTELRKELGLQKEKNSNSYRMQRLKWMYLTVKDMIEQNNFYIETEDEVLDILKNFGYDSDDIVNIENVIKEELISEKVDRLPKSNYTKEDTPSKDAPGNSRDNVVPLREGKVQLPNFMK